MNPSLISAYGIGGGGGGGGGGLNRGLTVSKNIKMFGCFFLLLFRIFL